MHSTAMHSAAAPRPFSSSQASTAGRRPPAPPLATRIKPSHPGPAARHVPAAEISSSARPAQNDSVSLVDVPEAASSESAAAKQVADVYAHTASLDDNAELELDDDSSYNLAVVDMGSNSFHLVVVKADGSGRYQVLDSMKEQVQLLSGGTRFNIITEEAEARALATMKRLRQIAETRGAELRCVATSAIREARNGGVLVRHIREQVGTTVEVISGQEEARLIYLGVLQALPAYEKRLLCIDIGGGSTEIAVGHQGRILSAKSVKLGHLRCMDACYPTLASEGTVSVAEVRDCRSLTSAVLADSGIREEVEYQRRVAHDAGEAFVAVGSSGNVVTIAKMIAARRLARDEEGECSGPALDSESGSDSDGARRSQGSPAPMSQLWSGDLNKAGAHGGASCAPDSFGDLEFSRAELHTLVCDLLQSTREERARMEGLKSARVDTVVAGAVLLQDLFVALSIDRMKVSSFALREGMIADTLVRMLPASANSIVADPRRSSLKHLSKRFNLQNHYRSSKHVARLAKQLLHGLLAGADVPAALQVLTPNDAFLLEAAALVHHVGMFISHSECHNHAYYIIKNDSHLLGFTPLELEMVAIMSKFHRKELPNPMKYPEVAALPQPEQDKLYVLVALLRVAIALDRRRTAVSVRRVTVERDAESAVILAEPAPVAAAPAGEAGGASPAPVSGNASPHVRSPTPGGAADAAAAAAAADAEPGAVHDIALELWAARKELENLSEHLSMRVSIIEGGEADLEPVASSSGGAAAAAPAAAAPLHAPTLHSTLLTSLLSDDSSSGSDADTPCVSAHVHTSLLERTDSDAASEAAAALQATAHRAAAAAATAAAAAAAAAAALPLRSVAPPPRAASPLESHRIDTGAWIAPLSPHRASPTPANHRSSDAAGNTPAVASTSQPSSGAPGPSGQPTAPPTNGAHAHNGATSNGSGVHSPANGAHADNSAASGAASNVPSTSAAAAPARTPPAYPGRHSGTHTGESATSERTLTGAPVSGWGRGEQQPYAARAAHGSAIELEWNMTTDTDGHVRARRGVGNGLRDGDSMLASVDSIAMDPPFGGWGRNVDSPGEGSTAVSGAAGEGAPGGAPAAPKQGHSSAHAAKKQAL